MVGLYHQVGGGRGQLAGEPLNILLITDNPAEAQLIRELLTRISQNNAEWPPFQLEHAATAAAGLAHLSRAAIDIILFNLGLGTDAFADIQQAAEERPVIILTNTDDEPLAVQAIRAGAQDYVVTGRLDEWQLSRSMRCALERQQLLQELRQKTQALETDERRLHTLIEQNSDGILVVSPNGNIRLANQAARIIFGLNDDPAAVQTFDYSLVVGETTELEIAHPNSVSIYEMQVGQTRWANETCFLAVLRNITLRKHTQEELIAERNLLRTVINNLPDEIFVKDLDSRFIVVNLATLRQLEASSLIGVINKTDADFYPLEIAERVQAEEAQILQSGQPLLNKEELVVSKLFGKERWVLSTKVPLRNSEGQVTGLVGIRRDITEQRQVREALQKERTLLAQRIDERTTELQNANRRLTHALRVKDEFLASMSHELRTPLNAILGMAEILQEKVYGSLNQKQANSLRIIQESGRHLLALINDILDVSKIEADKVQLDIGPVVIEDVCRASIRFVQQTAKTKKLSIAESYPDPPVVLQADERRLKQILVNLLSNAVKFTPEGGQVGLEVWPNPDGQTVLLTVWDTGIGIPGEHLEQVFQPFVQLDSRLARQYEGTGLGLALVQLLAELHGAAVSVTSQVGQGSRFTVVMPWLQPPETAASSLPAAVEPATGQPAPEDNNYSALILLAEDNAANVEVMSSYLSAMGYRVITAKDGLEAVAHAQKLRPDLILMDIHMPELDGLEATRQIRANTALANIPIVALTALAMPGDRERCLAAGVDGYLSKPVSLRDLSGVIAELLPK